ncbi:MAG: hypothetical protein IPJ75_14465 [Ignavibacteriales bacterium]|nr:hypothetical protein [Ignavibacteriales bacterium]
MAGGDYVFHGEEVIFYEDEDRGEDTYTILEENKHLGKSGRFGRRIVLMVV